MRLYALSWEVLLSTMLTSLLLYLSRFMKITIRSLHFIGRNAAPAQFFVELPFALRRYHSSPCTTLPIMLSKFSTLAALLLGTANAQQALRGQCKKEKLRGS